MLKNAAINEPSTSSSPPTLPEDGYDVVEPDGYGYAEDDEIIYDIYDDDGVE